MPTPEIPVDQQQVQERAETFPEIEKSGVQPAPTNFTPVNDEKGKPLTETPETKDVNIKLPGKEVRWLEWSKGVIEDAKTWLGRFFLREEDIKEHNANSANK